MAAAAGAPAGHTLEFLVDAEAPCTVTVHLFAREGVSADGALTYTPRDPRLSFPPVTFAPGLHQLCV